MHSIIYGQALITRLHDSIIVAREHIASGRESNQLGVSIHQQGAPSHHFPFSHDQYFFQYSSSHVQTSREHNIPPNHLPGLLHLLIQARITNQSCRTHDLPTSLVQSSHHSDNRTLHDICQICDVLERHASRPLVHHLHQTEARPRDEIVCIVR
jgi:hypothetical protein